MVMVVISRQVPIEAISFGLQSIAMGSKIMHPLYRDSAIAGVVY